MADLSGRTIGQYKIVGLIGKGGMATVYQATHTWLDTTVAVKVLPAYFVHDETLRERFIREAKVVAQLRHPNILPVTDFGETPDATYLVMEYVAGGSLKDKLTNQPWPLPKVIQFIEQIASALDYAHGRGIVHRDVKPHNILLRDDETALLADFGIVKITEATHALTRSDTSMGTPAYMSPEQWHGAKVDGRSDLYSLGVMLYEMLTGHQPYEADTTPAIMLKHITETPPPALSHNPALPPQIEDIIQKAMAKKPEERFQSGAELVTALKAVQAQAEQAERLAREQAQLAQLAVERAEAERLEREKAEQLRAIAAQEAKARAQAEQERLARERAEVERSEREKRMAQATEARQKAEQAQLAATSTGAQPQPSSRQWILIAVGGIALLLCIGGVVVVGMVMQNQREQATTATMQAVQAITTQQAMQLATAQAAQVAATSETIRRATATGQAIQAATAQAVAATATKQAEATVTAQAVVGRVGTQVAESAATTQGIQANATARARQYATVVAQSQQGLAAVTTDKRAFPPANWQLVVYDPFNDNLNSWQTGASTSEFATQNRAITNGKLRWEAKALKGFIGRINPTMNNLADSYVTVEGKQISGAIETEYGIVVRTDANNNNYYVFGIYKGQQFYFSLHYNNEFKNLIPATSHPAIKAGQVNRLTVRAEKAHFTLLINDVVVGEADNTQLPSGRAGIAISLYNANDEATFEFENFAVYVP